MEHWIDDRNISHVSRAKRISHDTKEKAARNRDSIPIVCMFGASRQLNDWIRCHVWLFLCTRLATVDDILAVTSTRSTNSSIQATTAAGQPITSHSRRTDDIRGRCARRFVCDGARCRFGLASAFPTSSGVRFLFWAEKCSDVVLMHTISVHFSTQRVKNIRSSRML